ncbi:MAG: hypothetical protein ACYTFY_13940 [Planctomycetota bacterium]
MMTWRIAGSLLAAVIFSANTVAAELEDIATEVSFYEDGEGGKNRFTGNDITANIRKVKEGKFSKALLIERRTVNELDNGGFDNKKSDTWLYRKNAKWSEKGGIDNSSCLGIKKGEVAVPLTDLTADSANAFSFYARSAKKSKTMVKVLWEEGGSSKEIASVELTRKYNRVKAVINAKGNSGTVRIAVKDAVYIDNAQLDKGVNFFNTYSEPLVRRSVDVIYLPPQKNLLNIEQGAISCWLNVPWLNDPDIVSNSICSFFSLLNEEKRQEKWGDNVIMGISAIARKKPSDKKEKSALHYSCIDKDIKVTAVSAKFSEFGEAPEDGWRLLILNWKLEAGQMKTEMWLDGKKLVYTAKPYGNTKTPKQFTIGYASGAYVNGLLDELAFFKRPLSGDEIQALFEADKALGELLK